MLNILRLTLKTRNFTTCSMKYLQRKTFVSPISSYRVFLKMNLGNLLIFQIFSFLHKNQLTLLWDQQCEHDYNDCCFASGLGVQFIGSSGDYGELESRKKIVEKNFFFFFFGSSHLSAEKQLFVSFILKKLKILSKFFP